MKAQVWVYAVVVVLSTGAGVAIAGVPDSAGRESTIAAPSTTVSSATTTTVAADVVTSEPAADDDADATSSTSMSSTTTTTTPTTSTTTTTTSTTTTTVPAPDRGVLDVATVNAASIAGAATKASNALEELGYVDVGRFDGSEIVETTVVFAGPGLQSAAERLAADAGIDPALVFPIDAMPAVRGLGSVSMVLYLGRDARALDAVN